LDRRDLLRVLGAVGAATVVPVGLSACQPAPSTPQPLAPDSSVRPLGFVGGSEVEVGQGGWCWFQSPRASFGPNGVLWLGTTVSSTGTDVDGTVRVTAFDTTTMQTRVRRDVVRDRQDDHTSPSVLALGDKVQVSWALHKPVDYLDLGELSLNGIFVSRRITRPASVKYPGRGMSYCSVHVVAGQRWLLYRGEQFSWNLLTSPDGQTWNARGLVVAPPISGQRPYLQAASDGVRLHMVLTDGNPTEYHGTSVYVGTIGGDLSIANAAGTTIGSVGSKAPKPAAFTRLVAGVAGQSEASETDGWTCDLRIVDGRPTGILSVRDPWPGPNGAVGSYRHRYIWIRQRSTGWLVEPLCWAGGELYAQQPDYSGLATQDPSEPRRVVVSTNVHPATAVPLTSGADGKVHWELFEGWRAGEGDWTWTPLTQDSVEDNLRPVIAAGGPAKALAWMRGTYRAWSDFDTRIVVRRAAPLT